MASPWLNGRLILRRVMVLLLALLSACGPVSSSPMATASNSPPPSPSATPDPSTGAQPLPLVDVTPAAVIEPPTFVPSPTPTLISLPLPPEELILESPGFGSQIGSPIHIVGWGGPSFRDQVRVRLIGEDGQVLAQARTYLLVPSGRSGRFIVDLPFQLPGVAEAALIEASIENPLTARLDHLTTRRVVLLSSGRALVHTSIVPPEKVTIFTPREDRVIEGGAILVRGAAWLDEDLPLLIEIIDRQGQIISSAEVALAAPDLGELGTFEATLDYTVPYPQYGWVAVTERGLHPPAVLHYTSMRVYLRP